MDKDPASTPTALEEVDITNYKNLAPSTARELLTALNEEDDSIEWELVGISDRVRILNARRQGLRQNRHLIEARARADE